MKIMDIVPQVFYDLIARILPGSVLLFCALLIHYGPGYFVQPIKSLFGQKGQIVEVSFYLFLFIGILSYTIAFILMGVWAVFGRIRKRYNMIFLKNNDKQWNDIQMHLKLDIDRMAEYLGINQEIQTVNLPSLAFIYDFVRMRSPEIGARLVKVRAECHMCITLVTGLVGLTTWNLVKILMNFTVIGGVIELGLVFAAFAFWFFLRDLEDRFITETCNYWVLLISPSLKRGSDA